jgi:hypothetical protein
MQGFNSIEPGGNMKIINSIVLLLLAVALWIGAMNGLLAQNPPAPNTSSGTGPATKGIGLISNDPGAFQGYTLISPMQSKTSFLIDMNGRVVKSWATESTPSALAYLQENGNLLRAGVQTQSPFGRGVAGGGGRVQEFTWDGDVVWDMVYSSPTILPHHDFIRLPNGNVLLIVKDRKQAEQAIAAGRIPSSVEGTDVQADGLVEIRPNGKTSGDVVWEWYVWDHLVQDYDKTKANYGVVASHPELVDINYNVVANRRANPDWTHFNAVAFNKKLNQLAVSLRTFSEIWIIDHSTTTQEAASHTGGKSGKGGDLLYRWGNPRVYRAGSADDQRLFGQHNIQWIADGLRGAGHLLVYNNGDTRPGGRYSSVDEFVPPVDSKGRYTLKGKKYGPAEPIWIYTAPNKPDFYSMNISGVQRLPNGNTLICAGAPGIVFEVTPKKHVVWQYNLPSFGGSGGPGGRSLFRAYRFGLDFPAFKGKTILPGKPLEEMAP